VHGAVQTDFPLSSCVVVGQHWHAWYSLLGTFKLQVQECYAPLFCPWVQHASSSPAILQWVSWTDFPLPNSVLFQLPPVVLIIQGPPDLLDHLYPDWFHRHHILFLGSATTISTESLPFRISLSHSDSGGVLDGSWVFFSNHAFTTLTPMPARRPAHLLKRTISAKLQVPLGTNILDSSVSLFPLQCYSTPVRCPTVHGTTTVVRWLNLEDLMSIFDVPMSALPPDLHPLLGSPVTRSGANQFPFLFEVPLKVLHKVYESWRDVPYSVNISMDFLSHPTWELPGVMYAEGRDFEVEAAFRQAVKADDAQVASHLWDDRIWRVLNTSDDHRELFSLQFNKSPLDSLRGFLLRRWRIIVRRSFFEYLKTKYGDNWSMIRKSNPELHRDLIVGCDCILKSTLADWWEWRGGSSLFFWR